MAEGKIKIYKDFSGITGDAPAPVTNFMVERREGEAGGNEVGGLTDASQILWETEDQDIVFEHTSGGMKPSFLKTNGEHLKHIFTVREKGSNEISPFTGAFFSGMTLLRVKSGDYNGDDKTDLALVCLGEKGVITSLIFYFDPLSNLPFFQNSVPNPEKSDYFLKKYLGKLAHEELLDKFVLGIISRLADIAGDSAAVKETISNEIEHIIKNNKEGDERLEYLRSYLGAVKYFKERGDIIFELHAPHSFGKDEITPTEFYEAAYEIADSTDDDEKNQVATRIFQKITDGKDFHRDNYLEAKNAVINFCKEFDFPSLLYVSIALSRSSDYGLGRRSTISDIFKLIGHFIRIAKKEALKDYDHLAGLFTAYLPLLEVTDLADLTRIALKTRGLVRSGKSLSISENLEIEFSNIQSTYSGQKDEIQNAKRLLLKLIDAVGSDPVALEKIDFPATDHPFIDQITYYETILEALPRCKNLPLFLERFNKLIILKGLKRSDITRLTEFLLNLNTQNTVADSEHILDKLMGTDTLKLDDGETEQKRDERLEKFWNVVFSFKKRTDLLNNDMITMALLPLAHNNIYLAVVHDAHELLAKLDDEEKAPFALGLFSTLFPFAGEDLVSAGLLPALIASISNRLTVTELKLLLLVCKSHVKLGDIMPRLIEIVGNSDTKKLFEELYQFVGASPKITPALLEKYIFFIDDTTRDIQARDIIKAEETIGLENAILLRKKFGITYFDRYSESVLRYLVEIAKDPGKDRDKPLVFSMVATNDHNGWFYAGTMHEHDERVRIVNVEVATYAEFVEMTKMLVREYGVPDVWLITAHGKRNSFDLGGEDKNFHMNYKETLERDLGSIFGAHPPQIIFNSCSTAAEDDKKRSVEESGGKEEEPQNIVDMFSDVFKTSVTGPRADEGLISLGLRIEDGRARLYPVYIEIGPEYYGVSSGITFEYGKEDPIYFKPEEYMKGLHLGLTLGSFGESLEIGAFISLQDKIFWRTRLKHMLELSYNFQQQEASLRINSEISFAALTHLLLTTSLGLGASYRKDEGVNIYDRLKIGATILLPFMKAELFLGAAADSTIFEDGPKFSTDLQFQF